MRQLFASGARDEKDKVSTVKNHESIFNNFENLCLIGNILCVKQPTEDPNIQIIKISELLSL